MPSTAESVVQQARAGVVRRLWWRSSQSARLAIGCLGVCTALATTGAAGFGAAGQPQDGGGPGAAGHRGDSFEVTVQSVSDVDLFEGAEPVTGHVVRARVAGLRPVTACWPARSRAVAQELLQGTKVRVVARNDDTSGADRMLVDVQLPDGTDYARSVVDRGVVPVDCAPVPVTTTVPSSLAPSTTSAPARTTTTPVTTTESSAPPSTTSSSPAPDEEWHDDRLGKPCLLPGARRTTREGNEMVCARNDRNQLRWHRAG
ncbi:hypothetical protein [Lentzea guizhouensis]|uniref:hypothetical protein n=1 Tax=Lentzea guizhouensis TaxID=1586287 RepID=UPI000B104086|nr:hypothetical protein [Lentzea guizhouensis]